MKNKFTLLLVVVIICTTEANIVNAQINVQDSLALVDLYNSTNGAGWLHNTNWLTSAPVNDWFMVVVSNVSKRVTKVALISNHLNGSLPNSIGNLTGLKMLNLAGNNLTGPIPSSIGNLSALQELGFYQDHLTGSIPASFGNLSKLTLLNLYQNQLSDTIPSSLGNLSNLITLNLYENNLTGRIPPSFGKLSNLQILDMNSNALSGNIPSSLGKLSNLQTLRLDFNQLEGTVPSTLDSLPSMQAIVIDDNKFTFAGMEGLVQANYQHLFYAPQASIPVVQNGTKLSVNAGGTLSNNTYKWYKNGVLVKTKTGNKNFTANNPGHYNVVVTNSIATQLTLYSDTVTIAAQVNMQDSLALVDLYNSTNGAGWLHNPNWLTTAPVNDWRGVTVSNESKRATKVVLDSNRLNGSLPNSIGDLTGLKTLNLAGNNLTGSIPSSIGNLSNLTLLDLSGNQLSDTIPSSLGNLSNLITFNLFSNNLTGSIPSSFGKLKNLQTLDMSNNGLSGNIPPSLDNLPSLQFMSVEYNRFTFAGIEGLVQAKYSLTYAPQANIPIIQDGTKLSVNAGGTLSNNTYKWYKNGVLVKTKIGNKSFTANNPGQFNVVVTNSIATQLTLYSDTVTISGFAATGLSADNVVQTGNSISIYPNPAKSNATLLFNATGKYSIRVTNLSGKILQTKEGIAAKGQNMVTLDVSSYAAGTYMVTITDERKQRQSVKFTKQ